MTATDEARVAQMLHHRIQTLGEGDPVALPVVTSSTFVLGDGGNAPYIYGRNGSPTWAAVEEALGLLEGADCVTFPSGMAAIGAALQAVLGAGRTLVLPSDGYYVSRLFAREVLAPYGVRVIEVPTREMAAQDFTGVAAVLVETPSNPGLDVIDIDALSARAHAAGAVVIADNTTMTPLLQRPLDLGADVVVAADTKAPAGHSDVLFGHVASRDAAILGRVRDLRRIGGSVPGAYEAMLVHRGLETLELRLARMCESAGVIAARLQAHPAVRAVRYPGLADDPSHAIARRQMAGFGFLVGMELESRAKAEAFIAGCPYLVSSTSFGATHSSAERRARWGDAVPEGFIRLSVGVEPTEVLWKAMAETLAR